MTNLNNENIMTAQTGSDNLCQVRGLLSLKKCAYFFVNSFNTFKVK